MNKMDQIVTSVSQTWNSCSESIAKIDADEEEPSPIDWSPQQQYHAKPPPRLDSDSQDQLLKFMSKMDAHEEEPSPIYWPPQQQSQATPST
jgi:hypothetical protein